MERTRVFFPWLRCTNFKSKVDQWTNHFQFSFTWGGTLEGDLQPATTLVNFPLWFLFESVFVLPEKLNFSAIIAIETWGVFFKKGPKSHVVSRRVEKTCLNQRSLWKPTQQNLLQLPQKVHPTFERFGDVRLVGKNIHSPRLVMPGTWINHPLYGYFMQFVHQDSMAALRVSRWGITSQPVEF